MNKLFGPYIGGRSAIALLVIRIVFGIGITLHGWDKVVNGGPFHWADNMGDLASLPHPLQGLATLAEVGGGVSMIFGFLTPVGMLGLVIAMSVALYKGHLVHGEGYVSLDRPFKPTYEVVAHYLALAVGLLFIGPGSLSLDALLFGRRRAVSETAPVP